MSNYEQMTSRFTNDLVVSWSSLMIMTTLNASTARDAILNSKLLAHGFTRACLCGQRGAMGTEDKGVIGTCFSCRHWGSLHHPHRHCTDSGMVTMSFTR